MAAGGVYSASLLIDEYASANSFATALAAQTRSLGAKLAAQIQALTVGVLPAMIDGWIRLVVQFGEALYEWADGGSRLGGSGRLQASGLSSAG